jgi:hypothetical protein
MLTNQKAKSVIKVKILKEPRFLGEARQSLISLVLGVQRQNKHLRNLQAKVDNILILIKIAVTLTLETRAHSI